MLSEDCPHTAGATARTHVSLQTRSGLGRATLLRPPTRAAQALWHLHNTVARSDFGPRSAPVEWANLVEPPAYQHHRLGRVSPPTTVIYRAANSDPTAVRCTPPRPEPHMSRRAPTRSFIVSPRAQRGPLVWLLLRRTTRQHEVTNCGTAVS